MEYSRDLVLMLILVPPLGLALGCVLNPLMNSKSFKFLVGFRILEFICATFALVLCFAGVTEDYKVFTFDILSSVKLEIGFRADLLSTSVLTSITLLSLCIFKYSLSYLNGDPNRKLFLRNFQWTVFSIVILTLANNLLLFFIAWLGTSLGLDRLLRHFNDRPNAILAAKKKWLISRVGDIVILSGIIYLWAHIGTFNYSEILAIASQASLTQSLYVKHVFSIVSLLFVFGAMTKSAQFPFHFWLPETMETPTPVSALMHAGIINAGGFLLIRLAPILENAHGANTLLTLIGGLTSVLGALIMMTQTDIKRQLAYSTISQLGFMMIQCGLGAYALALFHMFAHGFYKANLFLSTASALEDEKAPKRNLSKFGLTISYLLASALVFMSLINRAGESFISGPVLVYMAILVLAITQILGSKKELMKSFAFSSIKSTITIASSLFIYFIYKQEFAPRLQSIMPNRIEIEPLTTTTVLMLFLLFSLGIYFAKVMQDLSTLEAKRIWLFFYNGAYIPQISTRIIGPIIK